MPHMYLKNPIIWYPFILFISWHDFKYPNHIECDPRIFGYFILGNIQNTVDNNKTTKKTKGVNFNEEEY